MLVRTLLTIFGFYCRLCSAQQTGIVINGVERYGPDEFTTPPFGDAHLYDNWMDFTETFSDDDLEALDSQIALGECGTTFFATVYFYSNSDPTVWTELSREAMSNGVDIYYVWLDVPYDPVGPFLPNQYANIGGGDDCFWFATGSQVTQLYEYELRQVQPTAEVRYAVPLLWAKVFFEASAAKFDELEPSLYAGADQGNNCQGTALDTGTGITVDVYRHSDDDLTITSPQASNGEIGVLEFVVADVSQLPDGQQVLFQEGDDMSVKICARVEQPNAPVFYHLDINVVQVVNLNGDFGDGEFEVDGINVVPASSVVDFTSETEITEEIEVVAFLCDETNDELEDNHPSFGVGSTFRVCVEPVDNLDFKVARFRDLSCQGSTGNTEAIDLISAYEVAPDLGVDMQDAANADGSLGVTSLVQAQYDDGSRLFRCYGNVMLDLNNGRRLAPSAAVQGAFSIGIELDAGGYGESSSFSNTATAGVGFLLVGAVAAGFA